MENDSSENYLALFVTLSALLYLIEGAIPKPFPWMKLGLANIITIIALYFFDLKFLLKLIMLRVFTGALITATLFTPTFFLSLSGGMMAVLAMYVVFKICRKFLSPVGISIVGAEVHIFTQLIFVYLFLIKDKTIFSITPLLLLISLFTGTFVGFISNKVILKLKKLSF